MNSKISLKVIRSDGQWKEIFGFILTMIEESPSREKFFRD
jgi:hypothetical protein